MSHSGRSDRVSVIENETTKMGLATAPTKQGHDMKMILILALAVCALCGVADAARWVNEATVYSTLTNTVEGNGVQCVVFTTADEENCMVYTSAVAADGSASTAGVRLMIPTVTNALPATSETSWAATNVLGGTWTEGTFATSTKQVYPLIFKKNTSYKLRYCGVTAGETNKVFLLLF